MSKRGYGTHAYSFSGDPWLHSEFSFKWGGHGFSHEGYMVLNDWILQLMGTGLPCPKRAFGGGHVMQFYGTGGSHPEPHFFIWWSAPDRARSSCNGSEPRPSFQPYYGAWAWQAGMTGAGDPEAMGRSLSARRWELWLMTITSSSWVGHLDCMGRRPRLNGTKTSVEWEQDSNIEGLNFPHLVDRHRELFSHYPNPVERKTWLFQMGGPSLFQMGWVRLFQLRGPSLLQIGEAGHFQIGGPSLFQMRASWSIKRVILLSKLLSFAKECLKNRLNVIVNEDTALSHAFKHQDLVFMKVKVLRLLWSNNSSDLNMIEWCWSWMKRKITRLEFSRSRTAIIKAWTECWTKQLDQDRLNWTYFISHTTDY